MFDIINKNDKRVLNLKKDLENKIIPENIDQDLLEMDFLTLRHEFIKHQGYCIVTKSWTKKLSKCIGNKTCLEVMAGSGALSKALRDNGTNIITTDNFSWGDDYWAGKRECRYCDIENLSAVDAIKKYATVNYIIMCWPPYDTKDAYDVLIAMREYNPKAVLIYIGEDWRGCTADDEFFETAEEIEDHPIYEFVNIPQWWGVHDEIKLYV